jgi:hypothetical protein
VTNRSGVSNPLAHLVSKSAVGFEAIVFLERFARLFGGSYAIANSGQHIVSRDELGLGAKRAVAGNNFCRVFSNEHQLGHAFDISVGATTGGVIDHWVETIEKRIPSVDYIRIPKIDEQVRIGMRGQKTL